MWKPIISSQKWILPIYSLSLYPNILGHQK